MLHHPHVFCNHVRFSCLLAGSLWWAGQVWPRLIPCCCRLAGYGWGACHTAQERTSALLRFHHVSIHFVLDFNPQSIPETHHLWTCMGILHDLPQVHTVYDTRATQHATRQVTSSGRARNERFLARWQQSLVRHARLVAASTLAYMFGLGVCGAVGETRESQAGLPACDSWQQTQEDA